MNNKRIELAHVAVQTITNKEQINAPGSLLLKTVEILLNMAVYVDKSSSNPQEYARIMDKLEHETFNSVMEALGFKYEAKKVLKLLEVASENGVNSPQFTALIKDKKNLPSDFMLKIMM